jgi:hypothetical protein
MTAIIGWAILYNEVLPRMGLVNKKTAKRWLINLNVFWLFFSKQLNSQQRRDTHAEAKSGFERVERVGIGLNAISARLVFGQHWWELHINNLKKTQSGIRHCKGEKFCDALFRGPPE